MRTRSKVLLLALPTLSLGGCLLEGNIKIDDPEGSKPEMLTEAEIRDAIASLDSIPFGSPYGEGW